MNYKTFLKASWTCVIITYTFVIFETESTCTFPNNVINKNWSSTTFNDMVFQTQDVQFTIVISLSLTLTSWSCHSKSGNKHVIKATQSGVIFGTTSYFYYCLDLREQGDDSYLFYLQSPEVPPYDRLFTEDVNVNVSLNDVCTETLDTAEFNVMINSASPTSVKYNCATPLLADFTYECSSTSNDTGSVSTCQDRSSFNFNNTVCSATDKVLYSESGGFNCIAKTSTEISGDSVYYQMLYNRDSTTPDVSNTFQFVCLAVSEYSNGTVILSASDTGCTPGQTATSNTLYTLSPTVSCPLTTEPPPSSSSSSTDVTPIIIGVVVGLVVLFLIIGCMIFYFCFYKKDPNAGKPIVENTKPKFEEDPLDIVELDSVSERYSTYKAAIEEDPDKENILEDLELETYTPLTRDEITFEAMSPSMISNGRLGNPATISPTEEYNGGYIHNGTANGSVRRDSGIALTDKSTDRPTPRTRIIPSSESMVIFNGDEKVTSGNDTRIVPNENNRMVTMNQSSVGGVGFGILTLQGLEDDEALDELGQLSERENLPYPSLPREKSNLMPPADSLHPEKDGH